MRLQAASASQHVDTDTQTWAGSRESMGGSHNIATYSSSRISSYSSNITYITTALLSNGMKEETSVCLAGTLCSQHVRLYYGWFIL